MQHHEEELRKLHDDYAEHGKTALDVLRLVGKDAREAFLDEHESKSRDMEAKIDEATEGYFSGLVLMSC